MNRIKKQIAKLLVCAFLFTSVFMQYGTVFAKESKPNVQKDRVEILVKYKNDSKSDTVKTRVKNRLKMNKLELKKRNKRSKIEVVEIGQNDDVERVVAELKKDPDVQYAQPNYKLAPSAEPSDSKFDEQWGLLNKGQAILSAAGTKGVDVSALKAWGETKGSASVMVGVLDTGIDITHKDLKANIFVNSNEIAGNGMDDDGNGYIDDVNGWDFANDDAGVYDGSTIDAHGTHIAGIIAAGENGMGIVGVAPGVKILPLKFISGTAGYTSDAIEAIEYAAKMGVKIMNCSFGGPDSNQALKDAMAASDMLFVCAAGNNARDISTSPVYPASFNLPNIITAAAADNKGYLAAFSNYGAGVDVAAPGVGIMSTTPEDGYGYMSGTSMAAPFVAGTAALVKSSFPDMTPAQVASRIRNTVTKISSLEGRVAAQGMVNAYRALTNTSSAAEEENTGKETNKDTGTKTDTASIVGICAAGISQQLQEQIHYGESGVSVSTGNFSRSYTDMSILSPGFTVNISRTYNSKDDRTTSTMGRGWTFGFEGSLKDDTANPSGLKVAKLPNGGVQVFIKNADGTYTANDSRSTLVKNPDNTHTLTTKDQYTYKFDTNGWLAEMKDRNGNPITIAVDTTGKVQSITDAAGRIFKVDYDSASNLITKVTDVKGNRYVQYTYDTAKKTLTGVSDITAVGVTSPSAIATYEYDASNYLTKVKDDMGNILDSMTYDPSTHKVTQHTDTYGNTFTYAYDTANSKTTITDKNSRVITKKYDSAFYTVESTDPESKTAKVEYYLDANGYNKYGEEKKITDRNGNITEYIRDASGNITKIINPDKSYRTYEYDEKNNLIKETDETNRITEYKYDAGMINLLKKVQPLNGTDAYDPNADQSKYAITSYRYYTDDEAQQLGYKAKGLLKTEVDPEGHATKYTYDADGNQKTVTGPEGGVATTSSSAIGWPLNTISPKGYKTTYTYDLSGRAVKTELDDGAISRTVYDIQGRKIQEISPDLYELYGASRDTQPLTSQYIKDENNRAIGTSYEYYPQGKVKSETDASGNKTGYDYDLYGNTVKETSPDGSIKTYEYDVMNRLSKVFFKDSETSVPVLLEEYAYTILADGKTKKTYTKYLNASEKAITEYTYDYAERLVEQKNPDGGKIKTVYNGNGTVYSTTGANGGTAYMKYDGLGRLAEKWVQVDEGHYSYSADTYDKAGNKKQEKVSKDKVELFSIPAADRLIVKSYTYYADNKLKSEAGSSGSKTLYQYDEDGNLSREDVYTSTNTSNTTVYENNHLGKPVSKKVYVNKGDIYGNSFNSTEETELTTIYEYDKNGNLKNITTPDGATTTYAYDSLNRRTGTSKPGIDENGLPVTITTETTYDWEGKVLTSKDPNGNLTENTYSKRGFLTQVRKTTKDAAGNVTDHINFFDYDTAGRKTAEVSPANYVTGAAITAMNRTEYVYDGMDRVKAKREIYKTTPGAIETSFVSKAYKYDLNGNVVKELDGEGFKNGVGTTDDAKIDTGYGTEYTYNYMNQAVTILDPVAKDNGLGCTTRIEYDGAGRKISETDAKGAVTSYYYDDAGNLLSTSVRKSENDPELTVKQSTYDLAGNLLTQTDGNGNRTAYQYNALNKARKIVYPGDPSIPENTVTLQYDVMGNLVKKQDTIGTADLYTYDNQGRVLTHTQQTGDGKESITTSTAYDRNGNKIFETDGNGTVKQNTYDGLNRLIKSGVLAGGELKHHTEYRYDKNGNLTLQTDWRGNTTENIYDPINRVIEKKDPYRTIQKLEYDCSHKQIRSYDAKGNLTEYKYDRNNRLIETIDPEGHSTKKSYDAAGNVETKTDGNGKVTTYSYDQFNRLSAVINQKGEKTSYTYDLCGNLLTQTDGKGNTTTFEYNAANKQVKKIDQGGRTEAAGKYTYDGAKTESYTYYANGLMAAKTDRNGKVTTYLYDCHGRLLKQAVTLTSSPSPASGEGSKSYTYDNNGNQLSITDATGTTRRTYDEFGRVMIKSVPNMGTMTFQYDITASSEQWTIGDGLIEQGFVAEGSSDVKGNRTLKIFDKVGRLKHVLAYTGEDYKVTSYEYDDNGNRSKVIYPGGTTEEYQYDKDNKVTLLVNRDKNGVEVDRYEYKYDAAHNQTDKTEIINKVSKGITSYGYDGLNRLESVKEPGGKLTEYTFDKAGNRETEKVTSGSSITLTTYKYNEQNRLMSTTEEKGDGVKKITTYTYDNNGNLTRKGFEQTRQIDPANPPKAKFGMYIQGQKDGATENAKPIVQGTAVYEYDVWNQMVKAVTGDGASTMKYNGEGYRVEKNDNGTVTRYLYEADKVVLETDGNGRETARNVYGTNLLARTMGTDTYYYMYNGHADVTALLDTGGNVRASYYYDAFGNILDTKYFDVNGVKVDTSINNPFRYAGYQYDGETGLYYLNARMYDPKIARFMQEDTYSGDPNDPLSLNLYTYCYNNPVVYSDPTGHWGVGDSKRSPEEQAQILEATVEYAKAKEKNDKEAMSAAHQKAEDARNGIIYYSNSTINSRIIANEIATLSSGNNVSKEALRDLKSSDMSFISVRQNDSDAKKEVSETIRNINTARKDSNVMGHEDGLPISDADRKLVTNSTDLKLLYDYKYLYETYYTDPIVRDAIFAETTKIKNKYYKYKDNHKYHTSFEELNKLVTIVTDTMSYDEAEILNGGVLDALGFALPADDLFQLGVSLVEGKLTDVYKKNSSKDVGEGDNKILIITTLRDYPNQRKYSVKNGPSIENTVAVNYQYTNYGYNSKNNTTSFVECSFIFGHTGEFYADVNVVSFTGHRKIPDKKWAKSLISEYWPLY